MNDVAIVGAGPRGLAALQSLASKARTPLTIHLFGALSDNGTNVVGEGTPFGVGQPLYSRLNARSAVVDHFGPYRPEEIPVDEANPSDEVNPLRDEGDTDDPTAIVGADFDTWAKREGYEEWVNNFPPRAIIGEYLRYCADYIRTHLPGHVTLIEYPAATRVTGSPGEWTVESDHLSVTVPELLLTVGHADEPPNKLTEDDTEEFASTLIDSPYPLARLAVVADGDRVATRGAGLSFIDIALALTEGRGGTFSADGKTYTPSGHEPSIIYPTGLEGMFLDAKPDIDDLQDMLPEARWSAARSAISSATTITDILHEIREVAAELLKKMGHSAPKRDYDEVVAGPEPGPGRARAKLAESLEFADGGPMPTRTVLAGTAITLFEEILTAVANTEWPKADWEKFTNLITLVTNYGFGPPQVNARKLLTLVDAGIVSTEWLDQGVDALELPEHVDVMVEGLLAPPGYWPGAYPALTDLDEILGVWADPETDGARTGVRTDDEGSVLDADLRPVEGLAAIGRMTEDWIVSTDSLNRTVHPQIEGWAGRITRT